MHRLVPLIAILLAMPVPAANAGDSGLLHIEQAWSRATPPGTSVGAGYLRVINEGSVDDRLVRAASPRAGRVMLHRTQDTDGTATMQHQGAGIGIAAGSEVALEPGGYHLMLMQLEGALEKGDRVPLTLFFERAGALEVELVVRGLGESIE